MKKKEVLALFKSLKNLSSLNGVKFAYAIAKNINILKPEVDALNEAMAKSDEFKAYEVEREEIAKKYAKKTEAGLPMIVNNNYVIEDEKTFNIEDGKLSERSKDILDARVKQTKEYDDLLETDTGGISLFKIKLSEVPENITVKDMDAIFPIIEE